MFNPLTRRPKLDRLTVAIRGPAGTGKSTFAASAQALPQRLLMIDLEGKSRLLPGATAAEPPFDAIEIRSLDEIDPILDWALQGEGANLGYGTIALDSWAVYFGEAYAQALQRAGSDTLNAEQEQALQASAQRILRRLCYASGLNVILTDVIAARGKESAEANEVGRIVPLTAAGLEYMVDLVLDLDLILRPDDLDPVRIGTISKSNVPSLPIGTQIENPNFPKLLELAGAPTSVSAARAPLEAPTSNTATPEQGPTLEELLALAEKGGFTREQLAIAAKRDYGKSDLGMLSGADRAALRARIERRLAAHA